MSTLWRISSHADLSGEGGRISSARWHTRGKPVVYLADSPASAMLERMVHLQSGSGKLPQMYDLLSIEVPENLSIKDLLSLTEAGWRENLDFTRSLGDAWLAAGETAMARVPSAIMPRTWNYLLNPEHPGSKRVRVEEVIRERFDNRLFRFCAR